jgi:hypothetical protein
MKILFYLWGGLGFFLNLLNLLVMIVFSSSVAIGIGTASYPSAVTMLWIGGTLFFGLGAILQRPTDALLISK